MNYVDIPRNAVMIKQGPASTVATVTRNCDTSVPEALHVRVLERLKWAEETLKAKGYSVPVKVWLKYTLSGQRAGVANTHKMLLNFNPYILKSQADVFIERTVPHEYAHIVACMKYGNREHHGYGWKGVMRALGLKPERCHDYDLSMLPNRGWKGECNCPGKEWDISIIRKRRMLANPAVYTCRRCNGHLRLKTD